MLKLRLLFTFAKYRFQSLFFWIHFHKQTSADLPRPCRSLAGFNPCFSGFTSTRSAALLRHELHHDSTVSILVFLDSLPQRGTVPCCGRASAQRRARFQSLFFWIHFHKIRRNDEACRAPFSPSFNPCFSGFTSTRDDENASYQSENVEGHLGFQSLFFWIQFHKT